MRILAIALLICCCFAHAQHEVFTRKNGFFSPTDKINAFFFEEKTHRMVVRDEGDTGKPRYGSLDKAMRKSPCVAGVNGGFFGSDPEGTPLGMVVQDGKTLHPLETGSFTVTGIIYDTGRQLRLMRSSAFAAMAPKPRVQSAIQGGPFLVENGKPVKGLNDVKSTYRTFIATDGKSRWCIATTSSLTLRQLADWLATDGTLGSFKVDRALNMDGGTSSAFWCHPSGTYFSSIKQVRNYVGVAPRPR